MVKMEIIQHKVNNSSQVEEEDMIEIDVRDGYGEPVVSHDSAHMRFPQTLKEYLHDIRKKKVKLLAVNIKADGYEEQVIKLLEKSKISYFVFDMSRPSYHRYSKLTKKIALPVSEYDSISDLQHYKKTKWIWLDCFNKNVPAQVNQYNKLRNLNKNINIVFVSPDLHDNYKVNRLVNLTLDKKDKHLYICTDYAEDYD